MTESATERVRVLGQAQTYVGRQGFTYRAGASAETVGAEHVCMNVLPMPEGHKQKRTTTKASRPSRIFLRANALSIMATA